MLIEKLISQKIKGETVDLTEKRLKDEHIMFLCSADTHGIKSLRLKHNNFTPNGLRNLNKADWSSLIHLGLWGNLISNQGCKFLSRATFRNLAYLGLGECMIESTGISHLCKSSLSNLEEISLSINRIGCDSMKCLLKGNWTKLKTMFLGTSLSYQDQNKFELSELMNLTISPYDSMKTIAIYMNPLSYEEQMRLEHMIKERIEDFSIVY